MDGSMTPITLTHQGGVFNSRLMDQWVHHLMMDILLLSITPAVGTLMGVWQIRPL